ncbi:MAG: 2-oxoacid:acceptor oxidoreductase subunit alpha [Rhodothermales bacterium]
MSVPSPEKTVESLSEATVLFAGDSGDGMQLTGSQFTLATAFAQNDLATLPDFPAEIRAPVGTTYGVSGFQLHFGSVSIRTPGDEVDLLVAMNPAALSVNLMRMRPGGTVIVNSESFTQRDLELAGLKENPLENGSLEGYRLIQVPLTTLTRETLKDSGLNTKEIDRSKNMFALGLSLWLFSRPMQPAIEWITKKFGKKPQILEANLNLLKKGFHYGETTEEFVIRYEVSPAKLKPGRYRAIQGAQALALGIVAASQKSGLPIFYGAYPITPASDMLHELSRYKNFGVMTYQAEDEIAAACAALGASFSGVLGVTASSGPGIALKSETLGLGIMTELPMVVINVQRGGPSTGLPTKTEQSDLLMAMYGRNGEAPMPIVAASTPGDCFYAAFEACRIAVTYRTPVMLLSDGYLANGSAPWLVPDVASLQPIDPGFIDKPNGKVEDEDVFLPYQRNEKTLARPWARPGTAGLEHRLGGLEKQNVTGNVSYDPANHEYMVKLRQEKVDRVALDLPASTVYGDASGDVLIVGWGSTRGAIELAVDRARQKGQTVGSLHLRHINPLPTDLPAIFARYRHLIVPELNNGQLVRILRDKYLLPFLPLNKIKGMPFKASEINAKVDEVLG